MSNAFYLVPHFDELPPSTLFMLGFYSSKISVSDGLLFWRFISQKLPLLSTLSRDAQCRELAMLADIEPSQRASINAYIQLLASGIIEHEWIAKTVDALTPRPTDTTAEVELIREFNNQLKLMRPAIGSAVHRHLDSNPLHTSADAVLNARREVGENVLTTLVGSLASPLHPSASLLRQRFAEHLVEYSTSERFAANWASANAVRRGPYAGYLADVSQDLRSCPSLIPIFASSEVSRYLEAVPKGPPHHGSTYALRSQLAQKIGLATLMQLSDIGFRGIDEVVKMKAELAEELGEYNRQMLHAAALMSAGSDMPDDRGIEEFVDSQLIPSIKDLDRRVQNCKASYAKWLLAPTAVNLAGLGVAMSIGLPIEALIGLGASAITTLAGIAMSQKTQNQRIVETLEEPSYRGLSVIMKLKKSLK